MAVSALGGCGGSNPNTISMAANSTATPANGAPATGAVGAPAVGALAVLANAAGGCGADAGPAAAASGTAQLGPTPASFIGAHTKRPVSAPQAANGTAAPTPQSPAAGITRTTAPVAAAGAGATTLALASSTLQGSSIAQQVFSTISGMGAPVDIVDDAPFAAMYGPRVSGIYDMEANRIQIPRGVLKDPQRLSLVLLHEGVHFLQMNVPGGAEALGGSLGQALVGANAVRQNAPNTVAAMQHQESQAYLLEGTVANQLGIADQGLGVDAKGRTMSYDQILARVKATPEYQNL